MPEMSFEDLERNIERAHAVVVAVRQAETRASQVQSLVVTEEATLTRLKTEVALQQKLHAAEIQARDETARDSGVLRAEKGRLTDEVATLTMEKDRLATELGALRVRVGIPA